MIEGLREAILDSINQRNDPLSAIIGQEDAKEKILASLLASHHVLIEGSPGIGKTTLAKHMASALPAVTAVKGCPYHCNPEAPICPSCKMKVANGENLEIAQVPGRSRFVRLQGSPDLTAEDLFWTFSLIQSAEGFDDPESDSDVRVVFVRKIMSVDGFRFGRAQNFENIFHRLLFGSIFNHLAWKVQHDLRRKLADESRLALFIEADETHLIVSVTFIQAVAR